MGDRRHRLIEISGQYFDQMLAPQMNESRLFRGYTSDSPPDLHVIACMGHDPQRDVWTFVCESKEFDALRETETPPLWCPVFHAHYEGRPGRGLN